MEVIIVAWTSKSHKLTTFKVQTKKVVCGKEKNVRFCSHHNSDNQITCQF